MKRIPLSIREIMTPARQHDEFRLRDKFGYLAGMVGRDDHIVLGANDERWNCDILYDVQRIVFQNGMDAPFKNGGAQRRLSRSVYDHFLLGKPVRWILKQAGESAVGVRPHRV